MPGQRFRVWAPRAASVEVVFEEPAGGHRPDKAPSRRPLAVGGGGWHEGEVTGAGPGTLYRYSLDGAAPLPDPRSASQPQGVHGPSEVLDQRSFSWTDASWSGAPLASAVLYELHVGTFTPEGTFDAVVERLDHLLSLGVTAIELMPVAQFPGHHGWGYDGADLYAPHAAYGGPEGLKRLVNACHRRGIGVVLDVVYNHLGPDGNYLSSFGPYLAARAATQWGEGPNLDGPDSDPVREFLCDNACMWLADYHLDGLRLDAVNALVDASATHLLEELALRVERLSAHLGRQLCLVAETNQNDPRVVARPEVGGHGIDAQWSDDLHHALHVALTGERAGYYADFSGLADVATALRRSYVYAGRYSAFRRRRHGRAPTGIPGQRFVGFLQNHDQVGNRARGERITHLTSFERAKVGAALVACSPFVPLLFQGEEWGASSPFLYFTDHQDPALARAVSHGRCSEFAAFGWDPADVPDPQARASFAASRLDWLELDRQPHAGLLDWYRRLYALRGDNPALGAGGLEEVSSSVDEAQGWIAVFRGEVTVAANLSGHRVAVPFPGRPDDLLLASDDAVEIRRGAVELPPDSVAILGVNQPRAREPRGSPPPHP